MWWISRGGDFSRQNPAKDFFFFALSLAVACSTGAALSRGYKPQPRLWISRRILLDGQDLYWVV